MNVGFSTRSLSKGDFKLAVNLLLNSSANVVELSALRESELESLIYSINELSLDHFKYVSFHAPSKLRLFSEKELLTTAATIWISAALGMGVATGLYLFVSISAATVFVLLHFLARMESKMDQITKTKTYSITIPLQENILSTWEALFNQYHLKFKRELLSKEEDDIMVSWILTGSEKNHVKFIESILSKIFKIT